MLLEPHLVHLARQLRGVCVRSIFCYSKFFNQRFFLHSARAGVLLHIRQGVARGVEEARVEPHPLFHAASQVPDH